MADLFCLQCGCRITDHSVKQCPLHGNAKWLQDACKAVLLFHSGGQWCDHDQHEWMALTATCEVTSKTLCDFVRDALARSVSQ